MQTRSFEHIPIMNFSDAAAAIRLRLSEIFVPDKGSLVWISNDQMSFVLGDGSCEPVLTSLLPETINSQSRVSFGSKKFGPN